MPRSKLQIVSLTGDLTQPSDKEHAEGLHCRSTNHDHPSTEFVVESQDKQVSHEADCCRDERIIEYLDAADLADNDRPVERNEGLTGSLQEEVRAEDDECPAAGDALEALTIPRGGMSLPLQLDGQDDLLQLALNVVGLFPEQDEGPTGFVNASLLNEPSR